MRKTLFLLLVCTLICSCATVKNQQGKNSHLCVMTFNIRYDNPYDGINNWEHRRNRVANAILFYQPDIIGMQEVLHQQLSYLQSRLPHYAVLGVGREDGKEKGEYSALWYNKQKYDLIKQGYFWLSEHPEQVGKGWDAACERIATWAILKDRRNHKQFFFLNTHLDHVGQKAISNSIDLIVNKVNTYRKGLPVIITGDFNASPDSKQVIKLLNNKILQLHHARDVASLKYGPNWSFHNFGKIPYNKRTLIDYIFTSPNIKVNKWGVLAETENEEFLSDHAPVVAELEIE